MPNIDTAYQFIELEGNTAGTNGIIQVVGANTLVDFGNANTTNALSGYITLPEGVIMNYGSSNANLVGTVITFGNAYAVNLFSVSVASNSNASSVSVLTANTTKITLACNTAANAYVYWTALGI